MTAIGDNEIFTSVSTDDQLTRINGESNTQARPNLQGYQQIIYNYLLKLVRRVSPEVVLAEFRNLFIVPGYDINSEPLQAVYEIISFNNEEEFLNTLKRSCYILINNWDSTRQHHAIRQLIEMFPTITTRNTESLKLFRISNLLKKFINSKDYEEMKIFALGCEDREEGHWSGRYTSYLLVPQYIERNNPIEQRQAAKALARQLKDKFKFDLAMYTAHSSTVLKDNRLKNPTGLGNEVVDVIEKIVTKKGEFSYANLANIFLKQTQDLTYGKFKPSLQKYLIFSLANEDFTQVLNAKLSEKLKFIYKEWNEEKINQIIILKTCKYIIESLTIENRQVPSELFILFLSQDRAINLVILLLKIVLICPYSRLHLEACIAALIQHYKKFPARECEWVINFVEIIKIGFTIYTEDVEYNLIKIPDDNSDTESIDRRENYRVFSQVKRNLKSDTFKRAD